MRGRSWWGKVMMPFQLFLQALIWLSPVFAATLNGVIPDIEEIDCANTVVELRKLHSEDRDFRHPTINGSFAFYDLAPNNDYVLLLESDILKIDWRYLISVDANDEVSARKIAFGKPLHHTGPSSPIVSTNPLKISGYIRQELVVDRQNFSLLRFFIQPSVLLLIGCLIGITFVPSIIENMDPELLEEIKKNQIQFGAPSQDFDLAEAIANRRVKK